MAPPASSPSDPKSKAIALGLIGTSFVGTMLLISPFLWVPLKSPLPFMSTPRRKVAAALKEITSRVSLRGNREQSRKFKYYDLGSGDGETVLAVARMQGWDATGLELNGTLWALSNLRRSVIGVQQIIKNSLLGIDPQQNILYNSRFRWTDFWTFPIDDADVVMIFGVPSLMPRVANKIVSECRPGTFVMAYRFHVPVVASHCSDRSRFLSNSGGSLDAKLIYDKDEMRIYELNS